MTKIPEEAEEESDEEKNMSAEENVEEKIKQEQGEEGNTESEKLTTHDEMPQQEELPPRRDRVQEGKRVT